MNNGVIVIYDRNIEESDLDADESIINFRNGILNIDTEELLPHSPEYLGTVQIHYDWDSKVMLSTAKVTMKFLNDITMENADDKATILEYTGATISNVFTESERIIANRKMYEIENDSLSFFIEICCIVGEGRVKTREFKEQYRQWCKENKLEAERPNSISKLLKEKYGIDSFKSGTEHYPLTIKPF